MGEGERKRGWREEKDRMGNVLGLFASLSKAIGIRVCCTCKFEVHSIPNLVKSHTVIRRKGIESKT